MLALRVTAAAAISFLAGDPAAAQPAARTIYVWSYHFAPDPIDLAAGRPVTLTFVNRSGSSHDFTSPTFFAYARVISGDVRNGTVELPPGETKRVTLVPRLGTYRAHCSHFLHSLLGMNDTIVVR